MVNNKLKQTEAETSLASQASFLDLDDIPELYGWLHVWICPICNCDARKEGDLSSPSRLWQGEMICDDCRVKLRKLLGISDIKEKWMSYLFRILKRQFSKCVKKI